MSRIACLLPLFLIGCSGDPVPNAEAEVATYTATETADRNLREQQEKIDTLQEKMSELRDRCLKEQDELSRQIFEKDQQRQDAVQKLEQAQRDFEIAKRELSEAVETHKRLVEAKYESFCDCLWSMKPPDHAQLSRLRKKLDESQELNEQEIAYLKTHCFGSIENLERFLDR